MPKLETSAENWRKFCCNSRQKLALESSASFRRWIPARVSGKCVMSIRKTW